MMASAACLVVLLLVRRAWSMRREDRADVAFRQQLEQLETRMRRRRWPTTLACD